MPSLDPTCPTCVDWNAYTDTTTCHRCGITSPTETGTDRETLLWQAVFERKHGIQKAALELGLGYAEALAAYEHWLVLRSLGKPA